MYVWSFFPPGRVTQVEKAFHYTQLKHKGNGQSQTSSLGRPRPSANNSCSLLLYHESFAYSFGLLSCMELEKRNLFESPALIRDFLWASGLLDLVQLRTRTSGIRNNNNNVYFTQKIVYLQRNFVKPVGRLSEIWHIVLISKLFLGDKIWSPCVKVYSGYVYPFVWKQENFKVKEDRTNCKYCRFIDLDIQKAILTSFKKFFQIEVYSYL
ncbi:hypothetical protein AVEN_173069-1 [Araneus ventricosus]|uniref:Uncharacterized protein n=1 Tax=Araneus ventricosus TaxID=182803 RepID=A0A4Y2HE58_ARAVE|nr:hypothetical protein AVEN_173069-1 [Araneus ventricosus]